MRIEAATTWYEKNAGKKTKEMQQEKDSTNTQIILLRNVLQL